MDALPTSNDAVGSPESVKDRVLETGAGMVQKFAPVQRICAHLNAFHAYAQEPWRRSEADHYCAHVNADVRQCLLYDSAEASARLIGVEYMVTPRVYATLDPAERRLWHSHVFEVKSGMLVMPAPAGTPAAAWERAERAEMAEVVELYGKAYQLWQTDRGDPLPLGEPRLLTSFTARDQLDFDHVVGERDRRLGVSSADKAKSRDEIPVPDVHPDADATWKEGVSEDIQARR